MTSKIKNEKYCYIYFDGIDKSGKDTIAHYFDAMVFGRFIVKSRGVLTLLAYNELYHRNRTYRISEANALYVYLDVDYDDWVVRCKSANEPIIDYNANKFAFEHAIEQVKDKVDILRFNTSKTTPYEICMRILDYIETNS